MGHADQADRVRPADRSGDRGTPRVSAGRGWPGTSHGFLHLRRLHLRGAFGAEDHPIIDEWCCGYVKGIALDPVGWQPLIDARPDLFEVIHLYGTKCGWERLKELVDVHEDRVARHQAFVDRIAPAAGDIHAYWLTHRAPRERLRQLNKVPDPGRNDPCPCGSGKKFKRCHGAPDIVLH